MSERDMIELNGHRVDAHRVDAFLDGRTGEPISDLAWDESRRRLEADYDDDAFRAAASAAASKAAGDA